MQSKTKIVRYPRLDTLMMIEKIIEDAKGDFTVRQIWKKLPKKVMWQTYITALDYLESIHKIAIDKKHVIWIWGPEEIARVKRQKLEVKSLRNRNRIL
ncbi:MAG TPA: hypothetical protein PLK55_01755 [archaeon]|jgi:hypothetical protein|nr:hypothetical protein [archaeon]